MYVPIERLADLRQNKRTAGASGGTPSPCWKPEQHRPGGGVFDAAARLRRARLWTCFFSVYVKVNDAALQNMLGVKGRQATNGL